MKPIFDGVKKNFGFGCMRLPMKGDEVDLEETKKMVDAFLDAGFNYFDTAHGYLNGQSEKALKACLTSRYPREAYFLVDKLSGYLFQTEDEIEPMFADELDACGVTYFDLFLMHAQNAALYDRYKTVHAYEHALAWKEQGKIKHFGISFHDTAEVLERILSEQPAVEAVQLQLNYLDWEDPAVQSRKCLEVCRRHGVPVIVMEPVKGGNLVRLPDEAKAVFDRLDGGSPASYALRFAAGCEGVAMTLSGMSNKEQMDDNLCSMRDFKPLDETEKDAVSRVTAVFRNLHTIPCTSCRYCTAGCPAHIAIPDLFSCYNIKTVFGGGNPDYYYRIHTQSGGKASDCLGCGACEETCPQHLPVRALLADVAASFDKN